MRASQLSILICSSVDLMSKQSIVSLKKCCSLSKGDLVN